MATTGSKNDHQTSVAGGDIAPPVPKVNSLRALTRLRAKRGCDWCVFAFSLNRDMIKPDGTLDDLHAVVFPLGSFDDQNKAEEHAKNIIAITGHPGVIAAQYAAPVPLTIKFDPNAVTEVPVDMQGRLIEMESAQYKRERDEYERRAKQEREIMKEAEEETDPNSIEHFKRACYLAIKNRAAYQHHKREADSAWENYKKREMTVRDHFARHPDHEKNWLPYLKDKLTERGELALYQTLEAAYSEIRDELLGLIETDDESELSGVDSEPSSDDQCVGGVCMVPNNTSARTPINAPSEMSARTPESRKTDEDDEIIPAEDISAAAVVGTQSPNVGFVEEPDE